MNEPTWFLLLKGLRKVDGEIHSGALAELAGMAPKDASAWLCKLTRWGYLKRAGRSELGGKSIRYTLTTYGQTVASPRAQRKFRKGVQDAQPALRIAANPKKKK
jgi:DNA-binding IclR family transcriptional regulator